MNVLSPRAHHATDIGCLCTGAAFTFVSTDSKMATFEPTKDSALTQAKTPSETDEQIGDVESYTPEEEKKLVRRIDLLLMPAIWVMYLFSYADRTK